VLPNDPRYRKSFKASTRDLFNTKESETDLLLKGECDPRFAVANKLSDYEIRQLNKMNVQRKVVEAQPEVIEEQPASRENSTERQTKEKVKPQRKQTSKKSIMERLTIIQALKAPI